MYSNTGLVPIWSFILSITSIFVITPRKPASDRRVCALPAQLRAGQNPPLFARIRCRPSADLVQQAKTAETDSGGIKPANRDAWRCRPFRCIRHRNAPLKHGLRVCQPAKFAAANSQLTRFQKASTYFGRAFR